MRILGAAMAVLIGLAAIVASQSMFIVNQVEQALVLEFGKVKRVENGYGKDTPGLKFKTPFIQSVTVYDKRILDLDTPPLEVIALGQKRLVVDAFARYRIVDPLKFYQTVQTSERARARLANFLESSIRSVLGNAGFLDIVRNRRAALMRDILVQVDEKADALGVEFVDVRIKRADLPEANSDAIYRRMKAQREQEAQEIRSRGRAIANRITATADRNATVIRAQATQKSEILRGEGDAQRNAIFAAAFGKDTDFFAFYRSMEAYEKGLKQSDTRLVISPNSDFFRYFKNPYGTKPPAKPAN